MSNKMLIDATHPEETRVVVVRGNRVEEFDFESAARKPLRGNIFLAKVTRVEPSLQAAFVDYGGNRHGFLAFNEIHPDYYQIPIADRQALLDEEAEAEAAEEAEADAAAEKVEATATPAAALSGEWTADAPGLDRPATIPVENAGGDHTITGEVASEPALIPAAEAAERDASSVETDLEPSSGTVEEVPAPELMNGDGHNGGEAEQVESVGSEDALEEVPFRPRRRMRSYKIQEVIKRRQVLLVQVVKEERGNKGAALTTYMSLAGRYTVLMPNSGRGGGISRKITNAQDRKRLKAIADELEVPEGVGLIIRTAGAARTKAEIKRDFEYLLRLWESVRELTLQSTAPSLVYEEGDLIKRSIRDLYTKEVDEIVVAGEAAHREAKDFMRMLMPSHVKNVTRYEDPNPLFAHYQVERQLNAMFNPHVYLESGGYLVINQTEALVAIDVNSGKSTREFSIEETALQTNLEAAEEIARQLRLRDLAGLIVIDFIDMEEKRNNRAVERRMKDCLRHDRARIQVGRISHFGLLEMSRQRLRTSVLEGSTSQCPHCQGTGIIRSVESVALALLRSLENELQNGNGAPITATTTAPVALYILNGKRAFINEMEQRYGAAIAVQASDKMQGANFTLEKGPRPASAAARTERTAVNMNWGFDGESEDASPQGDLAEEPAAAEEPGESRGPRRSRRRRGRRDDRADRGDVRPEARGRDDVTEVAEEGMEYDAGPVETINGTEQPDLQAGQDREAGDSEIIPANIRPAAGEGDGERRAAGRRPRRRGHRGGRGRGEQGERGERGTRMGSREDSSLKPEPTAAKAPVEVAGFGEQPVVSFDAPTEVLPRRRNGSTVDLAVPSQPAEVARDPQPLAHDEVVATVPETPAKAPAPVNPRTAPVISEPVLERVIVRPEAATAESALVHADPDKPARKGWWQRRLSGD